jgi:hypothetical protein
MPDARTLAEFADYDGMLAAVRARVKELLVQGEAFDDFAGLPKGYLSKLIGARPARRIAHISMGPLFDALGIYCVVVEDPAATARLKQRLRPRNGSFVRTTYTVNGITNRKWARIQALGRMARWSKMTPAQRSEVARRLNVFRWRKNGNGHAARP